MNEQFDSAEKSKPAKAGAALRSFWSRNLATVMATGLGVAIVVGSIQIAQNSGIYAPWIVGVIGLLSAVILSWHLIGLRSSVERTVRQVQSKSYDLLFQEQLAEQKQELEDVIKKEQEFNALQREFVSMASHEFRTPLAIIDGAAHRILRRKEELSPEEITRRVTKIRSAVKRMLGLIESILDASKLDAKKIEVISEACDLSILVADVVERQQEISPLHNISIDVSKLPGRMFADAKLLDQVFTNLISNAVKYSPSSCEINVKGWVEDELAVVSVRDYGVGIPENEQSKLFSRFFRASTSVGIAGTGIGLNLVKELVEMHDGSVKLDSTPGKGSVFTIYLPISTSLSPAVNSEARVKFGVSNNFFAA